MDLLSFGKGNAKLDGEATPIYTFSLPAGWACPGAKDCLAKAARETGKITDGPDTTFRCFAASMEKYPSVRNSRWRNFDMLRSAKTRDAMAELIIASLPREAQLVRIHVSGDFFNGEYLRAWIDTARARPAVIFYAYTKSVDYLPARATLPSNLRITVSDGTRFDIDKARALGYAVASVAFDLNGSLPIDHDDSHAIAADRDFALLIHGTQPKGSDAAAALKAVKASGFAGYGKRA